MASTSNTTKMTDLFVPEVVADTINKKLVDAIRFAPLAVVDTTLVGRDGDTLKMPFYNFVGGAEDVAEGADIPVKKITQDTKEVKVSKIGLAVQFTDEALMNGNDNSIAEEAADQVIKAIADTTEAKLLAKMSADATLTATIPATGDASDAVADAMIKFGEDIEGDKVIIVPPSFYGRLLHSNGWVPNTEAGANIKMTGAVGTIHGASVVLSNRLEAVKQAYIVKPGALRIVLKRDTLVEFDRDKLDQTNYIIASKVLAPYVYDTSKIVKLTLAE